MLACSGVAITLDLCLVTGMSSSVRYNEKPNIVWLLMYIDAERRSLFVSFRWIKSVCPAGVYA